MPHVGGGSHSGGFHSGGGSGGSTTPIIRRDIYGNQHHKYYYIPGFYPNGIYVPYSRVHRGRNAIARYLLLFIFALFFILGGVLAIVGRKETSSLEDYSLDRYSFVYPHDDNYECNIMIEIIAYDNLKEIDYMPIVGDYVSYDIDSMFGDQYTVFGGSLAKNLEGEEYKVTNLYSILAKSLKETNQNIHQKYYLNNTMNNMVLNNTDFELGENNELQEASNSFYELTGYSISFDINTYDDVYQINFVIVGFLMLFGLGFLIIGTVSIIKTLKAVSFINKEENGGDLEKYYEGEIKFEEQIKRYPMDSPYRYDPNEIEALKKEFEIDKKEFEINPEEFEESKEE